jgi:putative PIN family toxin of toxin-antitoxin system
LRAVLDPNVLVSALLSQAGTPARALLAWVDGQYELVVSPRLLVELTRVLAYPKLRARVQSHDAEEFVDWLSRQAVLVADPVDPPSRVADADDDYLLALAAGEDALLVSGDKHLLVLADEFPILSPARFLEHFESPSE